MARNPGTPAYRKKSVRKSVMVSREASKKMRGAVKRTGKCESDIVTHGIMQSADSIAATTPRFGEDGWKEVEIEPDK
jgi:hypothetical protein